MEPMVEITKSDYDDLVEDARFLKCLLNAGVDNWDGYDFALDLFSELDE